MHRKPFDLYIVELIQTFTSKRKIQEQKYIAVRYDNGKAKMHESIEVISRYPLSSSADFLFFHSSWPLKETINTTCTFQRYNCFAVIAD